MPCVLFCLLQATSLNCAHSFCALCIQQWMAVKNECPNCRTPISSSVRSVVLDSYIDHMVEQLSAELKQRRIEIVAERKGDLKYSQYVDLGRVFSISLLLADYHTLRVTSIITNTALAEIIAS